DKHVDNHQIARLDAYGEGKEHEPEVAVEEPDGRQQPEDAAKAAVKGKWAHKQRRGKRAGDYVEDERSRSRSQHRNRVEVRDPVGVVIALEKAGQKPQREQLEERADQPGMHEAVSDGLPN